MDVRFLSNLHVFELGLFEIGGHPDFIERHHGEELLAVLNVHPDHHRLIHFTADRSNDFRVSEIELGLFEQRALLLNIRSQCSHTSFGR